MRYLKRVDDFLLALAAVATVDIVLFHFGAYFPFLQPESHSGSVERQARRVAGITKDLPGRRRIVAMGNSKTRASLRESQLEADLGAEGLRYQAINMAIGGSSPRSWYSLLTDRRFRPDNTEVVVVGINAESIHAYLKQNRPDLQIAKTRLKIAHALAMASTYLGLENRLEVFSGVTFRTLLFSDDVKQYLQSPSLRHRQVAEGRAQFEALMRESPRIDNRSHDNLLSARLGDDGQLVFDELDEFLKHRDALRRRVQHMLRRRDKKLHAMARGKKTVRKAKIETAKIRLLDRLVDELNSDGIKVVFCIIPISPYSLGRPMKVDHLGNFFRALEERGADVAVWHDPEMLRKLHSPAYYQDTLHLNAAGAKIYTRGLARFLAKTLATP